VFGYSKSLTKPMPAMTLLRHFRVFLVITLIAAASPVAMAQGTTSQDEFFSVPPSDRSAQLLEMIFGPVFSDVTDTDAIAPPSGVSNNQTSGGMLGVMSEVISVAALAFAAFIVGTGALTAVADAAWSGSKASNRYSSLWVPIRTAVCFAALAPVAGGYCLAQVIVMQVFKVSIGVANSAYTRVIGYVNSGNPVSYKHAAGFEGVGLNLLASEVCYRSLNTGVQRVKYTEMSSEVPVTSDGTEQSATSQLFFGPDNRKKAVFTADYLADGYSCGHYSFEQTYEPNTQVGEAQLAIHNARVNGFRSMQGQFRAVANTIVQFNTPSASDALPSEVQTTDNSYVDSIASNAAASLNEYTRSYDQGVKDAINRLNSFYSGPGAIDKFPGAQEAIDAGWMMAGAIYWNLASVNQSVDNAIIGISSYTGPDFDAISDINDTYIDDLNASMKILEPVLNRARRDFLEGKPNSESLKNLALTKDQGSEAASFLTTFGYYGADNLIDRINANGDPIMNLAGLGRWLYGIGMSTVIASSLTDEDGMLSKMVSGKSGTLSTTGSVVKRIPGLGTVISALGKVASGALKILSIAAPLMIVVGIFLGFYLPFVPLLLWIINICGWLATCIKAVFAAPLWAAAHAIPEGEGFAGQSARQGYFLLLSLMFRPVLMLVGLIAGILLLQGSVSVASTLFPLMLRSASNDFVNGLSSVLIFTTMYAILIVVLAHKAFALSHELGEEITRWIGQGAENFGDSQGSERLAGVARGATQSFSSIATSSMQSEETKKRNKAGTLSLDSPKVGNANHQSS